MKLVSIQVDLPEEVFQRIPEVVSYLGYETSHKKTSELIALVMQQLVDEFRDEQAVTVEPAAVGDTITQVLEPDISVQNGVPTVLEPIPGRDSCSEDLRYFERIRNLTPDDPWVVQVLGMPSADSELWQRALVTVYRVVSGKDRHAFTTWALIESTFRLLKNQQHN